MLFGAVLWSRWPAAKIKAIDVSAARRMPGVRAAILVRDGERTVRYYGEELAAVAASSKQAALDALAAIKVDADPQPFVVGEVAALQPRAPRVFAEEASNAGQPRTSERGDVEAGFAEASVVVEGMMATQVEIHHPMETHGGVADYRDGELTAWHSTQGTSGVRDGLAGNLELSQYKVRVICEHVGGGFGSKFSAGVEGVPAARLSKEAGAPVRLMLTRFDQSLAVGNRPSTFQKMRLGAKADGTLTAFTMESFGCAGYASGGASAGGSTNSAFPAPYIYTVPNVRTRHVEISMNTGSAAALRAPGHPPASVGMESIMDDLAVHLGMDPVELRLRNNPSESRRREYAIAMERFGWMEKYASPGSSPGPVKRGIGCAGATWGGGGRGTQAELEVNSNGTLEIRCGTQDLGTGTRTLIAVVASELPGSTPAEIGVRPGDSRFPPSGASGGSTTAASVSPAIHDVCTKAIDELKQKSGLEEVRGAHWRTACRKLGVSPLIVRGQWKEGLSSSGAGGVQMAEVEVEMETGFVRPVRILCVQDCRLRHPDPHWNQPEPTWR
ncbi:MAG TPA: xanthine dehydrogenase family protein [Opitutaceae bacterium]